MLSPPHNTKDAALALFRPLIDRIDLDHRSNSNLIYNGLSRLRAGEIPQTPEDPRLLAHFELMRQAFERESGARRGVLFQNWSDLHNHLRFAYVPAGRALLDFHSEAAIAQPPMDALMLGIGLTATSQEAPQRLRDSGKVLLPAQWFPAGAPIEAVLRSPKRHPALDTAYRHGLARLDEMLLAAERGLPAIHQAGLRKGAKASLFMLRRLQTRLARRTPNIKPASLNLIDRLLLRWTGR